MISLCRQYRFFFFAQIQYYYQLTEITNVESNIFQWTETTNVESVTTHLIYLSADFYATAPAQCALLSLYLPLVANVMLANRPYPKGCYVLDYQDLGTDKKQKLAGVSSFAQILKKKDAATVAYQSYPKGCYVLDYQDLGT